MHIKKMNSLALKILILLNVKFDLDLDLYRDQNDNQQRKNAIAKRRYLARIQVQRQGFFLSLKVLLVIDQIKFLSYTLRGSEIFVGRK